jgi:hypothetical protein
MLRLPLDRSSGQLQDRSERYAQGLCERVDAGASEDARASLAIYNRQYWFRLFGALQHEYALTARLLGAWEFNAWASRFLCEAPPRSPDLVCAADGFAEFVARELCEAHEAPDAGVVEPLPARALVQAAALDEVFRRVFQAPEQARFDPHGIDAGQLVSVRLQWSQAVALYSEDWPLMQLRGELRNASNAGPVRLPPRHVEPRHWAVCRVEHGQRILPLAAAEARLFGYLQRYPIGEALSLVEETSPDSERAGLAEAARGWLAKSVREGFWTGTCA